MFKGHNSRGFLICFGLTLVVLLLYGLNVFETMELKTVDYRFQKRGNRPVNKDIAVIAIDEASMERLGRWPWPRRLHAKLVRSLDQAGAKVVAFDSLFTETDMDHPESDADLAQAAEETQIVVSAFFFKSKDESGLFGEKPLFPYPALEKSSRLGYVNSDPDQDGVTRRLTLVSFEKTPENNQVNVLPSLAVSAFALSQGKNMDDTLSQLPIKINMADIYASKTQLFINYAYPEDRPDAVYYPFYSYADVLEGKVDMENAFKNKVVFVGATAAALFDLRAIPFIEKHPGVMIHVNALDNLMTGQYLRDMPGIVKSFYILFIGLLLGFLMSRFSPWVKMGSFLLVVGSHVGISLWLFSAKNFVVPMVPPLFVAVGSYGGLLFYRLVVEEREKRKIKGSFKQYLSPKIIDIITKDPSKLKLGGEEREVSIFFLDIAGFTTMSETLKPSQLVEVMNHCLTEFSDIILKHDGLINKYIGDCIMAFWNAPADQPRHASQACLAALECIEILPTINRTFQSRGLPSIDCRVGINTGTVVVGNMGSNEKFDYTVMGDPVNLASRLEGANKEYHTRIMVSDVTFEKAKEDVEARDLDLIRVKGKKEPRKVFEILGKKGTLPEEILLGREKYHTGLNRYRNQRFEDAVQLFSEVFDFIPNDYVTRVYLERARTFLNHPPPVSWDGVFEMKTK